MDRKDAIEIIRKNMPSDKSLPVYEAIQTLIPELAENDDERIREEMIRYFTEMKKGGSASLPYDDCIAYLKQKEYKLTEEDKKIIPEALVMLCDDIINHRVHTPIKTDEEGARKIKAFLKTFNRQPYKTREEWEKLKEQKPAEWSDEDEAAWGDLMWCIEQARKSAKDENDMGNIWFAENWVKNRLKSLRPQPKEEWSEEDEDMLNSCISSIEEAKENRYAYKETDGDTSYDHEIAWLESLRNRVGKEFLQPHWKPSEEHFQGLRRAILKADTGSDAERSLKDIYEQLKKL